MSEGAKQREVFENDELEIDLREIFIQLKRYWIFILVSVCLSTGLMGVYSFVLSSFFWYV